MRARPLALPVFLAVLLLSGCAGTQDTAAPSPHAVTGVVRGPLSDPVVDPSHHLVYGFSTHGVSVLNEATGRVRVLDYLGRQNFPVLLAVDPGHGRLLVEDVRIDRTIGPHSTRPGLETTLADDIDARTGRVIASARVGTVAIDPIFLDQGSVAIDPALRHGFVTDVGGHGVMIDVRSGRLLAHFNPGTADSIYVDQGAIDPAAVDERSHLLFIAVAEASGRRDESDMTVVDTRSGHVLRRLKLGLSFTQGLLFDAPNRRVVEAGPDLVAIVGSDSGTRLHTAHPGVFVDPLGIDSLLHRVFLLAVPSFQNDNRRLVWIDEVTGRVHIGRRYANYPGGYPPVSGIADSSAGRLFVLPGDGTLGVFSTATGHLLRRLPIVPEVNVLRSLCCMAVDEGAHRLVISGPGGALLVDTRAPYTH